MMEDDENNSNNEFNSSAKFKLPVEMDALFNFSFQFQGLKETILWIVEHLKEKDNIINQQQNCIEDHNNRINDLEAQMSDNEELLSWMAKWKTNFSEIDLNDMKDELEKAHEKINTNKSEINQNFTTINIQNSKIVKNEINIDELKRKLDEVENVQLNYGKEIENNKKEIEGINHLIETILERLDKVRRTPSNVSVSSTTGGLDPSLFVTYEYFDEKKDDIIRE